MKWHGVVEGFYGKPWTLAERIGMFSFLSKQGFNLYVYAPKDDPYHRVKWAEPYPPDLLAELGQLVSSCRHHGLTFCFAISPGLTMDYSNEEHFARLVDKCEYLASLGVDSFGLFFDDIPAAVTRELAASQALVANRLATSLRQQVNQFSLLFCPTKYQGDPSHPYVKELGEKLDKSIDVFWTGPIVCSKELTAEHTRAVSRVLQRPVLYWDNYPVNDAAMSPELHIGPYIGREPDLTSNCQGIVANPMELAESSKIALYTIGRFLADPYTYDPQAAWHGAIREVVPEQSGAFYRFAQANLVSPIHPKDPPVIIEGINAYREFLANMDFDAGVSHLSHFGSEMIADSERLLTISNQRLLQEITPWVREYQLWGELAVLAAELMGGVFELAHNIDLPGDERAKIRAGLGEIRDSLGSGLQAAVDFDTKVCGYAMQNFLQDVYRGTKRYV